MCNPIFFSSHFSWMQEQTFTESRAATRIAEMSSWPYDGMKHSTVRKILTVGPPQCSYGTPGPTKSLDLLILSERGYHGISREPACVFSARPMQRRQ